jgi:hypothetical protein
MKIIIFFTIFLTGCASYNTHSVIYTPPYKSVCKPIIYCNSFPTLGEVNSCRRGVTDCIRAEIISRQSDAYSKGRN